MRISGGLHAYIVTGRSEERERLAFRLAEEALCSASDAPCGICSDCRKAAARAHPDLHEIRPDGAAIKVDQVRDDVRTIAQIKPNEAARHAFVIHEADKMNTAAQNALLAVIEEPPTPCIFIFVCENERTLLATVRSRCGVLRAEAIAAGEYSRGSGVRGTVLPRQNLAADGGEFAQGDSFARACEINALPEVPANLVAAFCGRAKSAADIAEAMSLLAKLKGDEASRLLEAVRAALVRLAARELGDGTMSGNIRGANIAGAGGRALAEQCVCACTLAARAQDMLRANVSASQVAAWLTVELG